MTKTQARTQVVALQAEYSQLMYGEVPDETPEQGEARADRARQVAADAMDIVIREGLIK